MSGAFPRSLDQAVAIVTGGSSGIGRATCFALAAAGAHVVVVGTSRERVDEAFSGVCERSPRGTAHCGLVLDVRREEDMAAMATEALTRFGRIDVLIASAAILRPADALPKPLAETPVAEWDDILAINLRGLFLSNRAVLPAMIGQRRGDIVNLSSVSGLAGRAHDSPYCASKFAVMGLSQVLDQEVRRYGVRVQVVCPDATETPIWAQNRPVPMPSNAISPDRVARLILFHLTLPEDACVPTSVVAPFHPRRRILKRAGEG